MIFIREASEDDFKLLAELGRRAFQEAFGKFNDPGDMQAYLDLSFNPDKIQEDLLNSNILYFIASYKNIPVGYSKMIKGSLYSGIATQFQIQLERIYVLDAFIGKKVGKALMEKCIQFAMDNSIEYIWLSVWQENIKAVRFYKKWNFEIVGHKKFKLGAEVNDDFVMALKVSDFDHKN